MMCLVSTNADLYLNGIPCAKLVVPSIGSTIHRCFAFIYDRVAFDDASIPGAMSSSPIIRFEKKGGKVLISHVILHCVFLFLVVTDIYLKTGAWEMLSVLSF